MENVKTAKDEEGRLDKMLLDLQYEKDDANERRKTSFLVEKDSPKSKSELSLPDNEDLKRLKTKELILNIRDMENQRNQRVDS